MRFKYFKIEWKDDRLHKSFCYKYPKVGRVQNLDGKGVAVSFGLNLIGITDTGVSCR